MGSRLLVLLLAVPTALVSTVAANAHDPIQPGDLLTGGCALNFVFRSLADTGPHAGKMWMGTSAGCAPVGAAVTVQGGPTFGTVVYEGDEGTEQNGISGLQQDFALIEVDPAYHASLDPAVKGLGDVPRSYTATPLSTTTGERVLLPPAESGLPREGRLLRDDDYTFTALFAADVEDGAPVIVAASGRALGVVSGLRVTCCLGGAPVPAHEGPMALHIETELRILGWPIEIQRAG